MVGSGLGRQPPPRAASARVVSLLLCSPAPRRLGVKTLLLVALQREDLRVLGSDWPGTPSLMTRLHSRLARPGSYPSVTVRDKELAKSHAAPDRGLPSTRPFTPNSSVESDADHWQTGGVPRVS